MSSRVRNYKKNHLLSRLICLLIGSFIITFLYNKFLVPYDIVVGGLSGLAVVVKEAFGISTTVFINIGNVILVILSFIMLGKKKTIDQLIGTVMYLVMLNITSPLAKMVSFEFESEMLMMVIVSIFYGICLGLIFRPGYSTGGSDFLAAIISEKMKIPMTKVSLVFQVLVIMSSIFIFSIPKVMYSLMVIYLSNKVTNLVLFGISTSKMVYVISDANDEIKDYIMNKINTGATEIRVNGGFLKKKKQMLLCVVHNAQYERFKNNVMEMDSKAFIISNNCYEVSGGQRFSILPF